MVYWLIFFYVRSNFPKNTVTWLKKQYSKSIHICRLWLNLLAEKTGGKTHNLTLIILKVIFLVQRNALRPLISNLTCLSILQDATRSDIQVWYEFHEILENLILPIIIVKKEPEILRRCGNLYIIGATYIIGVIVVLFSHKE